MSTDLATFLAPGSLVGTVAQRVCEYLSVQDLLQHIASVVNAGDQNDAVECNPDTPETTLEERRKRLEAGNLRRRDYPASGAGYNPRSHDQWRQDGQPLENIPNEGGGDEAGGGKRACPSHLATSRQTDVRELRSGSSSCSGQGTREANRRRCIRDEEEQRREGEEKHDGLLGILISLGMQPLATVGALGGSLASLLGGLPLLALLRWAAERAASVLGVTFRVALLPYDMTRGAVSYVVGAVEAIIDVATEIWCELRHLSLGELACVVSCVVSGNSIPECLLPPLGKGNKIKSGRGQESRLSGASGDRVASFRSRQSSSSSLGFEEDLEYPVDGFVMMPEDAWGEDGGERSGRIRMAGSSLQSDDSRGGGCGSRGAWRQAHALRRRLDRANRTASLVSYEERAHSAVSRERAERVRRRMHYAMPLQCFEATVTVDGHGSPAANDGWAEDESAGGDSRGGASSADPFMCTPQSFPPTPVSRADVMARVSRFADDVLFLARDRLRLGENLKAGVDETTRATADFLNRQQRLAVLDGNNAGEGITLSCGQHRATKVGPSLYSSVRAMVPVLRHRHVYFQVSCKRDGPLAPCIGVGLSTPEMPLSTLVGAFSNSVGLCSTGQILMSSRWYGHPGEYAVRRGGMSTIGVLVYLDGSRSFRSWDGEMVRALVCFSIDGRLMRVSTSGGQSLSSDPDAADRSSQGAEDGRVHAVAASTSTQWASAPHSSVRAPREDSSDPLTGAASAADVDADEGCVGGFSAPEEVAPWESVAKATLEASRPASYRYGAGGGVDAKGGLAALSAEKRAPQAAGEAAGGAAEAGASAAMGLALPKDRDLFPTVTIHSANTEILCRFCAEDLLPVSREHIGAPPGAAVYALDGSLINFR